MEKLLSILRKLRIFVVQLWLDAFSIGCIYSSTLSYFSVGVVGSFHSSTHLSLYTFTIKLIFSDERHSFFSSRFVSHASWSWYDDFDGAFSAPYPTSLCSLCFGFRRTPFGHARCLCTRRHTPNDLRTCGRFALLDRMGGISIPLLCAAIWHSPRISSRGGEHHNHLS